MIVRLTYSLQMRKEGIGGPSGGQSHQTRDLTPLFRLTIYKKKMSLEDRATLFIFTTKKTKSNAIFDFQRLPKDQQSYNGITVTS